MLYTGINDNQVEKWAKSKNPLRNWIASTALIAIMWVPGALTSPSNTTDTTTVKPNRE